MTEILLRVELHSKEQARTVLKRNALPWIGEQLAQGRELALECRLLDDCITDEQRGYYHAVVLAEIAAFARPNGEQFPVKVWKEHFRKEFLGFKTVSSTNPLTGRRVRQRVRISTEDLGVRAYAKFIDQVIAFAATELGVTVSEPLPPHLRGSRAKPAPQLTAADMADEDGVIREPEEMTA